MKEIEVIGSFGDETKTIRIAQPHGAAGIYHISTNHWHDGVLHKVNGEWCGYFNARSYLTGNDIMILAELIEQSGE